MSMSMSGESVIVGAAGGETSDIVALVTYPESSATVPPAASGTSSTYAWTR